MKVIAAVVASLAASLVAGGLAYGQGEPAEIEPAPIPETTPAPAAPYGPADTGERPESGYRWMPASGFGMAVMAGGGVTDFTGGSTRAATGTGGSWDVRFAIATRYFVGFEASYIGAANSINGLGLSGNSTLVRNGLEGVLRVNLPLYARETLLEPYVLGGAGWNSYRVTNVRTYTASVTTNTDNTVSIPLGIGFAVGYRGFIGDVRYTIRPTYQQDILSDQGSAGLTNWDAGAMVGYEF